MQCTQCSSDNVQKLSVIYQMGTQQINTTSRTSGGGAGYGGGFGGGFGSAHTRTTGTSQSIMAQQVAPPKKKEYMITALLVIAGLVTIFMIESALIGLLFVGLGGFLGYKAYEYNANEWPPKMNRWQKSWHCNRCGEIYAI